MLRNCSLLPSLALNQESLTGLFFFVFSVSGLLGVFISELQLLPQNTRKQMRISALNSMESRQGILSYWIGLLCHRLFFHSDFLIVCNNLLMYGNLHWHLKSLLIKLYGRIIFLFKYLISKGFQNSEMWLNSLLEFIFFLKDTIFKFLEKNGDQKSIQYTQVCLMDS